MAPRCSLVLLALLLPAVASAGPAGDAYEDLFGVHCGGDPDPKGTGISSRVAALQGTAGLAPVGFPAAVALALAMDEDRQRNLVRDYDAAVGSGEDRHAAFERAVLAQALALSGGRCHVLPKGEDARAVEALAQALLDQEDAPVGDEPEEQVAALLRAWVLYALGLHAQGALVLGPAFPSAPWAAADRAAFATQYVRTRKASVGKSPLEDADQAAEAWSEAHGADRTHRAVEAAVAARLEALWRAIGGEAARRDDWSYALRLHDASGDGDTAHPELEAAAVLLKRAEEVGEVARAARERRDAAVAAAARREAAQRTEGADRVGAVQRSVSVEALLQGRPALGPTAGDAEVTGPVVREALDAWSASARAAGQARAEAVLQWVRAGLDGARACLGPDSRLQHDKPWACDVGGAPPEITMSWTAVDKTVANEVHATYIERGIVGEREVPRPPPEAKSGLGYEAAKARVDELTARQRSLEEQWAAVPNVGRSERERAEYRLTIRNEEMKVISEGKALLDEIRAFEEWRANPTMMEPIQGDVERQELQLYARFTAEVTARVRVDGVQGPERRLRLPLRARTFSDQWHSGVDRVVFDEVARNLDLGALTLGRLRERFAAATPPASGPEVAAAAFLEQPDAARWAALIQALEADAGTRATQALRAENEARLAEARAEAEALAARQAADEAAERAAREAAAAEAAALEAAAREAAARVEAERRAAAEAALRAEAERRAAAAAEAAAEAALAEARRVAEAQRRPVEIRGVVLADGQPASGAVLVSACGASTPLGADGSFSLTVRVEPEAATCEARASRIDPVLIDGPAVSVDVRGERAEVRLDLPVAVAGRVGVAAEPGEGALVVVGLAPDGPGARAGLRVGDRIVAVDGLATTGWSTADFVARAIGAPGSSVALTVQGRRGGPKEVVLVREAPPAP